MIYMRGIKGKAMEAILDFIYCGEANIYQEELNDFLALAETENDETFFFKVQKQNDKKAETKQILKIYWNIVKWIFTVSLKSIKQIYLIVSHWGKFDNHLMVSEVVTKEDVEAKIMSLMEKIGDGISTWRCTVCGKTAKTSQNMKTSIETHL